MIKTFITISLLFLNLVCLGQNLTLDQAIATRTKSLGSLEEYLTAKNWQLTEAVEATDSTFASISFAYNKNSYDDSAEAFITSYTNTNGPLRNRLRIQINRRLTYNAYLLRIKALGFVLTRSKIEDDSITKTYKNKTTVIRIMATINNENTVTKTHYIFGIYNRNDYELNFQDLHQ